MSLGDRAMCMTVVVCEVLVLRGLGVCIGACRLQLGTRFCGTTTLLSELV